MSVVVQRFNAVLLAARQFLVDNQPQNFLAIYLPWVKNKKN